MLRLPSIPRGRFSTSMPRYKRVRDHIRLIDNAFASPEGDRVRPRHDFSLLDIAGQLLLIHKYLLLVAALGIFITYYRPISKYDRSTILTRQIRVVHSVCTQEAKKTMADPKTRCEVTSTLRWFEYRTISLIRVSAVNLQIQVN